MKLYGLIGKPLGHSLSAHIFNGFFEQSCIDAEYKLFELSGLEDLISLIESEPDLAGLNVTSPYKEDVLKYVDECEELVKELGAANVIKIIRNEGAKPKLKAYNTDCYGFMRSLDDCFDVSSLPQAIIFGTGGAAKSVAFVLEKNGLDYQLVSRKPQSSDILSYEDLSPELIASSKFLINATPVGMAPNENDLLSIPYEGVGSEHFCYDLIYRPQETRFLSEAKRRGAKVMNGMEMLVAQAVQSWLLWQENND